MKHPTKKQKEIALDSLITICQRAGYVIGNIRDDVTRQKSGWLAHNVHRTLSALYHPRLDEMIVAVMDGEENPHRVVTMLSANDSEDVQP